MFTPTVIGTGLAGYGFLQRTRDKQQALYAQSPQVTRDTQHFMDKLNDLQSSDELMEDRALLRVALGAFGLDEDINNRAFIKKILDSDLSDSGSLANKLADKRYLAFAKAFNFAGEAPQLDGLSSANEVMEELAGLKTADDLLRKPALLTAALSQFGLEGDRNNTFFLKQVLNSDVTDPNSFANRLSDPRYAEMAEAFGFAEKLAQEDTIYGFAAKFDGVAGSIKTADDLFADPELLEATLEIFGLENDIYRPDFLRDVLDSDLGDTTSVANTQDDTRYLALAEAFGFHARAEAEAVSAPYTSRLEKLVETVNARETTIGSPSELFSDIGLMLDTFAFFDLPSRADGVQFAAKILNSDRDDPLSYFNLELDQRYHAFADAFIMKPEAEGRIYPAGFAEGIVQNYLDRQFEIQIGQSDSSMRVAMSLERELNDTVKNALSNDAQWYGVLASKPLRTVFETIFGLPPSFGALDIDRQLNDMKVRAQNYFGTDDLADFADPEMLDQLRNRYLTLSGVQNTSQASNSVLTLLSGN
ncbi:MAG: DUF1217 domain-containing protein [Pseudomonadota bacterium]|nr:DUF1217 domain-containing protein [Pseudomonadota bacterium]